MRPVFCVVECLTEIARKRPEVGNSLLDEYRQIRYNYHNCALRSETAESRAWEIPEIVF